ncbi:hypothetical protein PRJ_2587 [Pseudomonas sp. XWY-1]|nr:hypothetical protein PRJ_2587 [Pseudomonas sp. XWY-1]
MQAALNANIDAAPCFGRCCITDDKKPLRVERPALRQT